MGNNKQPVGERRRLVGGEGGEEEEDIISPLCRYQLLAAVQQLLTSSGKHTVQQCLLPFLFLSITPYNIWRTLRLFRDRRPSQQQQKASIVEQRPPALQPRFRQTTYYYYMPQLLEYHPFKKDVLLLIYHHIRTYQVRFLKNKKFKISSKGYQDPIKRQIFLPH